jgi:hypothetical protein
MEEIVMRRLALAFLAILCIGPTALGQTLDCTQFRHNEDGSWTPISMLTVTGPGANGATSSGYAGEIYVGPRVFASIDLATKLNRQCLSNRKITGPR